MTIVDLIIAQIIFFLSLFDFMEIVIFEEITLLFVNTIFKDASMLQIFDIPF